MGCLADRTRQTTQQQPEKQRVDEKLWRQSGRMDGVALNPEETAVKMKIGSGSRQQNQPHLSTRDNEKNSVIILTPPTTLTVSSSNISQKPRREGWELAELYPYPTKPKAKKQIRLSPRPAWTIAEKYVDEDFSKTGKVLNLNHERIMIDQLLLKREKSSK